MYFRALDSTDTINASIPNISIHVTSSLGPNTSIAGTSTSISNPKTHSTRTCIANTSNVNTFNISISCTSTPGTSISSTRSSKISILGISTLSTSTHGIRTPITSTPYISSKSASNSETSIPRISIPGTSILGTNTSNTSTWCQILQKKASKSITPAKKTVIPDKNIISEEVLSSTQVFNSRFVNEIKNLYIEKVHEKNRQVIQAYNNNKNIKLTQLPKIQQVSQGITQLYIEFALDINWDFYTWLPF